MSAIQPVEQGADPISETATDEYQEQLDELIDLLDTDQEPAGQESAVILPGTDAHLEPETVPEPEKPIDLDELKKQAFQTRPTEAGSENLTEVRSIALGGEEDVFVEVEVQIPGPA